MASTSGPFYNDSLPDIAAEDINAELTSFGDEYYYKWSEHMKLIQRIFIEIATVCAIINLCANIISAYLIVKFKKLRMNKCNVFLANFNLLDSLMTILFPLLLRFDHSNYSWWWCGMMFGLIMILGSIIMLVFVVTGWYLKTYYPQKGARFDKRVGVLLACTYVFIGFCAGLVVEPFFNFYLHPYMVAAVAILLILYVVYMLVVNVLHFVKKKKLDGNLHVKTYPLMLANIFFLSKLPFLIVVIILLIDTYMFTATGLGLFVALFTTGILALMQGVYFLIVLYVYGEDFGVLFRHVFSCKHVGYDQERLDSSVIYTDGLIAVENQSRSRQNSVSTIDFV